MQPSSLHSPPTTFLIDASCSFTPEITTNPTILTSLSTYTAPTPTPTNSQTLPRYAGPRMHQENYIQIHFLEHLKRVASLWLTAPPCLPRCHRSPLTAATSRGISPTMDTPGRPRFLHGTSALVLPSFVTS